MNWLDMQLPNGDAKRRWNQKVTPEQWEKVDWNKRDARIAEELGISRERVRQKRADFGQPKVTALRETQQLGDLSDKTAQEVGEILGITPGAAAYRLRKAGLRAGDGYRHAQAGRPKPATWKYPWDKVDWSKNNTVIAEELGCSNITVLQMRNRLGKPRVDGRKNPRR